MCLKRKWEAVQQDFQSECLKIEWESTREDNESFDEWLLARAKEDRQNRAEYRQFLREAHKRQAYLEEHIANYRANTKVKPWVNSELPPPMGTGFILDFLVVVSILAAIVALLIWIF